MYPVLLALLPEKKETTYSRLLTAEELAFFPGTKNFKRRF
jgi:hypothetical protein